jgi:hypothetical protein
LFFDLYFIGSISSLRSADITLSALPVLSGSIGLKGKKQVKRPAKIKNRAMNFFSAL